MNHMNRVSMLHVLLLNYEFPPMGGGAGHASFQMARVLVAQGYQVDVVTSGIAGQPPLEVVDGVRIHRVRSLRRNIHDCGLWGAWSYVISAQPVVRRLLCACRYDVIHYFFGLPTGLLSLCTPGAGRVPSVISLRGSDVPGNDLTSRVLRWSHRLLLPITRRIWRCADQVVANSEALRALAERVLPEKTIGVIPNGIEHNVFQPRRAADADQPAGKQSPVVRVLTVARLVRRKGLDDLLQALALLKDDRLRLTIQGWGSDGDRLHALAVRLGVYRQVTFAGFAEREQLPPVYHGSDIFVLSSHSESCAMALLEAMACGLPVVATRVGGMIEKVQDGINGLLVPPSNPQALAEALRRLIDSPELRRTFGERNAMKIQRAYSWEDIADQYLALYRDIIAGRRA